MSPLWIDPNSCETLAILVESVASAQLTQHPTPICLEVDIADSLAIPADAGKTADIVGTLVTQAVAEMNDGGELTITAVETAGGIELEIADTGRSVEDRQTSLPFAAAAIGAKVHWQNCPQGGAAATVVFQPKIRAIRKAA